MSRRPLVAALALLACSVSAGAGSPAPRPVAHTVVIEGMQFTPATLTIRSGDSVTWVNKDIVDHTATTPASAKQAFDSGKIATGKSWKRSFKASGTYEYVCTYHPTMKGAIRVTGSASAERPPRR